MRRRTALTLGVVASLAMATAAEKDLARTARAAVPGPDVGVDMTASPDPVAAGGTLTYTINVTNHDTATPADVTLTVTLLDEPLVIVHEFIDGAPVPVVGGWFTSASSPCPPPAGPTVIPLPDGPVVGGSDSVTLATPVTNTVTCTIPALAPSTTSTITITAEVARGINAPAPLIVNTARVSSLGDPNPANDVAVTNTCVVVDTTSCLP